MRNEDEVVLNASYSSNSNWLNWVSKVHRHIFCPFPSSQAPLNYHRSPMKTLCPPQCGLPSLPMSWKKQKMSQQYVCITIKLRRANNYQARELAWLLDSLQETLVSLKSGLEECYALLAPIEPGSTLVLSSSRSESIKGHITRVGTRIVKGVCEFLYWLFCRR